jgi:branched-chain amino acid transport system ATP-binding protein
MLKLDNVSRAFGGLAALHEVSLEVQAGQIIGLIGPNGAGKTTLINCISGLDHPNQGTIFFNEHAIHDLPAHKIARLGLARTYQNIRLLRETSVLQNILVAQHALGQASLLDSLLQTPRHRRELRLQTERAQELLARFGLETFAHSPAASLPYGDQRRLELARALATCPSLILLDEPTAGMNPIETREFGENVLRLREEGLTLLVIEHDMAFIGQVCDAVYVLNFGQMIAHGTPDEVKHNPAVISAYLGAEDETSEVSYALA